MARDGLHSLLLVEAEAGATNLPDVPRFEGVEFLEFAVDEQVGHRLSETLQTLGSIMLAATARSQWICFARGRST